MDVSHFGFSVYNQCELPCFGQLFDSYSVNINVAGSGCADGLINTYQLTLTNQYGSVKMTSCVFMEGYVQDNFLRFWRTAFYLSCDRARLAFPPFSSLS